MPDRHHSQGTGRTLKDTYIEAWAHAANFSFVSVISFPI